MSSHEPQQAPAVVVREIDGIKYVCIPADISVDIDKVFDEIAKACPYLDEDKVTLPIEDMVRALWRCRV